MAKVYDNSYEAITQRVIDFTYDLWKAGVWGVDLGVANRLKVNADGEIDVNVISGGGGGGGGTEYTEGDTDATITGSAIMWEDTSDTLRSVSAAKPLPVNVVAGGTSGGATETKQDDQITQVGEVQATPTANTVLGRLKDIDDAVSGTLTVDATGQGDIPVTLDGETVVLGTGSAQIGKLAANDGVDIGDVDVTSTPASGVTPIAGAVTAANLTSEHAWTQLINNSGSASAKMLWIQNHCDQSLEIAYNDSPNPSADVDIDDYIGPWTAREIQLKSNEGLIDTDVYIRQYSATPTLGSVFGTLYS